MANDLIRLAVMFGLPTLGLGLIVLLVILALAVYMHFRRQQRVDALEVLFKELCQVARRNKPDSLSSLWMVYHDGTPAIRKGNLVGYNRCSLMSSYAELYQTEKDEKGSDVEVIRLDAKTKFAVDADEHKKVKDMIESCGQFVYVLVYEFQDGWRIPGVWARYAEKAVLCFKKHVSVSHGDGRVILNAPGTETHGFFFEVPSGNRDEVHVFMSVIQTFTWIRALAKTQGNLFDVSDRAIEINPTLAQLLMGKQVEKPNKTVIQKG